LKGSNLNRRLRLSGEIIALNYLFVKSFWDKFLKIFHFTTKNPLYWAFYFYFFIILRE